MFEPRHPTKNSPGLQHAGIVAKLNALIHMAGLAQAAEDFRLTTPTIHVGFKFANNQPLDEEERQILSSFTVKRGRRDFLVTPMVNGQLDGETGFLSTLELIKDAGILALLPKKAEEATLPEHIMFNGFLRWQPVSVLWDVFDGTSKGNPFGTPKPWVVDELQVLGLVTVSDPVSDGTRGRPPRQLNITSWGEQFVELTRRRAGFEITDAYRKAARRRSGNIKPRFTMTDTLVSGYLAQGKVVPARILNKMSTYGKQELSKAYGVEL